MTTRTLGTPSEKKGEEEKRDDGERKEGKGTVAANQSGRGGGHVSAGWVTRSWHVY